MDRQTLLVLQFGIAVHGGMDFIVHHALAHYDQYIQQPVDAASPPARAFLFLDLTNMFNEVSREEARHQIATTPLLQPLLPYFDLMYGQANQCFYTTPEGTIDYFEQQEGFPQGDPLSPALASLVLHTVLEQCNNHLAARAATRRRTSRGDDNNGSQGASLSYLDDTSLSLPYEDLASYIQEFSERGPQYGIILNKLKTKILTTDKLHLHTPLQTRHLQTALSLLSPKAHVTTGLRFLGSPIGTLEYRKQFLVDAAQKIHTNTQRLFQRMVDPQTAMTLFKVCTIPSMRHLLAADLLAHSAADSTPAATWHTQLTRSIQNTIRYAIQQAAGYQHPIPDYALHLAHQAISKGGLGLTSPSSQALPATFVPLLRTIHYATKGDPTADIPKPPPIYTRAFKAWAHSRTPPLPIAVLQRHMPIIQQTIQQAHKLELPPSPQEVLDHATRPGCQRALATTLASQALIQLRTDPALPDEVDASFQSLLSPLTFIPLHSLSRRNTQNHFSPPQYTTALRRKLRLPLYPAMTAPPCPHCQRQIDPYGDHFFSCSFHKGTLHNRIRDALYTITNAIAPTVPHLLPSQQAVRREPLGLVPENPTLRPADIAVTLNPSSNLPTTIAIDVTITPPPVPLSRPMRSPHQPKDINGAHLACISRKFVGRSSPTITAAETIQSLTTNGIALIPFTVDPLGGIGYFAHRFLFHATHTSPTCPPPPDSTISFASTNTHSQPAFQKALDSSLALTSRADNAYRHHQRTIGRFASSNSAATPSKWATHTLALNTTHALTSHINRCQSEIFMASSSTAPEPNTLLPSILYVQSPTQTRQPSTPRTLPTNPHAL